MVNLGASGEYTVDVGRSRIGFTARHALISKVRGEFADFEGHAHLDFEDPAASMARLVIDVASIDTGNGPRDEELRTNGFLDVAAYPSITFCSTAVEQIDGTRFDLTGDLSIKATTRELTLRFELVRAERGSSADTVRFKASTSVNRRDWKVEWPAPLETGGVLVGDKVALTIEVTATRVEGS